MVQSYTKITVKNSTNMMIKDCKKIFVKYHPEFEEIPISDNKMVYELAKRYLYGETVQ